MVTTITLSWPRGVLWPNRKAHWAVVAKHRKIQRAEAWGACKAAGVGSGDRASVALTFCAPDGRRFDLDGCLSACKAAIDGIAHAIGVDDSRFAISIAKGEPRKGGAVVVEIVPAPARSLSALKAEFEAAIAARDEGAASAAHRALVDAEHEQSVRDTVRKYTK